MYHDVKIDINNIIDRFAQSGMLRVDFMHPDVGKIPNFYWTAVPALLPLGPPETSVEYGINVHFQGDVSDFQRAQPAAGGMRPQNMQIDGCLDIAAS